VGDSEVQGTVSGAQEGALRGHGEGRLGIYTANHSTVDAKGFLAWSSSSARLRNGFLDPQAKKLALHFRTDHSTRLPASFGDVPVKHQGCVREDFSL